jgi:gamma-glutamylcyclotransferase (GGCT)/AIG2-like uncharacterized protein YtfP
MDESLDRRAIVAVYGTLRRGCRNHGLMASAEPLGEGSITGRLWIVGTRPERPYPYPALLLEGDGRVEVECYRLTGRRQLALLDRLEAFRPHDLAGSEYVRRRIPVVGARVAWAEVYVYRGPRAVLDHPIPEGRWTPELDRS